MAGMNHDSAMPTCRSLALYGNHHGRHDAVCACHCFMNQDSAMPACKSHHDRNAFVRYHALLGCESLIHVDLIPLLFICGTHIFLWTEWRSTWLEQMGGMSPNSLPHMQQAQVGSCDLCRSWKWKWCCVCWQVNIQQNYGKLSQILLDHYTEEDRLIVASPSAEQINLLLAPATLRQTLSWCLRR